MNLSSSLFNSTDFLNNPISNSTQYEISLILPGNKITQAEFKLNKTTGKVIIEYSDTDKVRFNLNDILSLQNEEDLEPISIHNSKIAIIEKYGQNIFNYKTYVIIHYYPKKQINSCSIFNLCKNCSICGTQKIRDFAKIRLIMKLNDVNDLKGEISQRFGSMLSLSNILNSKNKKFIFFTYGQFNNQNTHFSCIKQLYNKSKITIEFINQKEIYQNVINNININEVDGILICDDNNSFVHKIINFFFKRSDFKNIFEKIPFGFIPSSSNINLKGGALSKSILTESKENFSPETAAFITSLGGIKYFDLMEILFPEQNITIYSLISLQWANNANFYFNLDNPSCSFCCCNLLCSCLNNNGFRAKIEYNFEIENEHVNNELESMFGSNELLSNIYKYNINGSNISSKPKIEDKYFSYFLCSNLPYINNAMNASPLSFINNGVFDLITMDINNSTGYQLYNQIKNYQYSGDYFLDSKKIKSNLKINYEKGNYLKLNPDKNCINSGLDFYIDGERYKNGKFQLNIIPSFMKVFCGIYTED